MKQIKTKDILTGVAIVDVVLLLIATEIWQVQVYLLLFMALVFLDIREEAKERRIKNETNTVNSNFGDTKFDFEFIGNDETPEVLDPKK